MIVDNASHYKEQVIALLRSENLPVTDLPASLNNFLAVLHDDELIGVAGLEVYGEYGLLRSLAVQFKHRGSGIAGKLVTRIEALGTLKGLKEIYLLTETAPEYFKRKGFVQIDRSDVPAAIRASSEFSHICPASAIVMKKLIRKI